MERSFSQCLVICSLSSSIYLFVGNGVNAVETNGNESTPQRRPINLQSLSTEEKKKFKDSFDMIFTDCDGVLYTPTGVISNAHKAVNELVKEGKSIRYITNNGQSSKAQIAEKLTKLGFPNVTEDSIVNPVNLVIDYLREKLPPSKSVYVIGPEVICKELLDLNIKCFGPGKDEMSDEFRENIFTTAEIEVPEAIGAVVVGLDTHFNYLKILKALRYLSANKDCLFLVLGPDETFLSNKGDVFPATGALASSITAASGRTPFVLGKPSMNLVDMFKTMAKDPQRAVFIGDNPKTDILMGRRCSFRTILVLTGVGNLDDVERYAQSKDAEEQLYVPEYYTNAFSDLT